MAKVELKTDELFRHPSHTIKSSLHFIYFVPTGLALFGGLFSIDIMSLTGQSVNWSMKDARILLFSCNNRMTNIQMTIIRTELPSA